MSRDNAYRNEVILEGAALGVHLLEIAAVLRVSRGVVLGVLKRHKAQLRKQAAKTPRMTVAHAAQVEAILRGMAAK